MSFTFNWPRFSDQFHYDAIQMLNTALNKGNKPPVIADKIEVVELEMGTQSPELEIRDIGDLTMDQFRGIFRLTYSGDAHLVLKTKVQANPLNHKQPDIHLITGSMGMLAAKQPLVVPMLLRLSHFKLNSYVVLVVSKQKGITLVFKTDPLQNVDINSTFDSIAVIQKFIQREIEGQLRQMFREDLPGIIHRLSQQWVKAKVEAPYLNRQFPPAAASREPFESRSTPDLSYRVPHLGLQPHLLRSQSSRQFSYRRSQSSSGMSVASTSRRTSGLATRLPPASLPVSSDLDTVSSPVDSDNFDPTYGLRPEGLPLKSLFSSFANLFSPTKGLADLAEEPNEEDTYEDEPGSFDIVDWGSSLPNITPSPSIYNDGDSVTEYETIPAVGGGTVTRPRIWHSQSMIQPPSSTVTLTTPHVNVVRPLIARSASIFQSTSSPMSLHRPVLTPYFSESVTSPGPELLQSYQTPSQRYYGFPRTTFPLHVNDEPERPITPDSLETQHSHSSDKSHSVSTPPSSDPPHPDDSNSIYTHPFDRPFDRRPSITSTLSNFDSFESESSLPDSHFHDHDPKIVLRPSHNNTVHHLSTLSHSNHTLSPYTRSLEHFTVRSVPPRCSAGNSGSSVAAERQPAKAKRKRTYWLGGKSKNPSTTPRHDPEAALDLPPSPTPSSGSNQSDMDRYFRSHDDSVLHPPDIHPTHVRRRQPYPPS